MDIVMAFIFGGILGGVIVYAVGRRGRANDTPRTGGGTGGSGSSPHRRH